MYYNRRILYASINDSFTFNLMNQVRLIVILLLIFLQAHLLRANDCTSILSLSEKLIEQKQYDEAIKQLKSSQCQSSSYYNLLMRALIEKESYAQVRQYASSCLQIHTNDSNIKTTAYFWDAIALYHLKQYSEAEKQIINAETECSDKESTTYATICNAHGNILESLKSYTNALEYYTKALKIYQNIPEHPSQYKWIMGSLSNIANIYIQQNNKKAEEYLQQAMQIFKQHPENTLSEYLVLLNNIGQYYSNKKDYKNSAFYYKKAVEVKSSHLGTKHSSYGISLLNLITSLYNNEQYKETAPYIEEYLEFLRYTLQRNFTVMSETEREKYWNSQSQILDNLLVTATYAALSNKNADASLLYNICLLSKSLLLDTSIKMEQLLEGSANKSIKNTYKQLKETEQELIKLDNEDILLTKHLSQKSDSLQQCLFKQLESLQSQMSQLQITWQDIQKQLTKNDIAVEFVCLGSGKNTEYAVILLRSNWKFPKVFYLNSLAETLEAKQITPMQMHDNAIFGKLVWQYVIDEVNAGDRIYFVPAGELQLMAAEHFSIREGYRMNEIYEMHRLSSTKQLLLPKSNSPHQKVALIGGMDYNASIEEMKYYAEQYNYENKNSATNNPSTKIWLPLPGALKEVQNINSVLTDAGYNTFFATHDAATDAALFSLSGKNYDIIHIATHGFYAETKDNEMQKSGLVMAGANTLSLKPTPALGDGILTTKELSKLNFKNTQLAVLSACQTGVGNITTEGVFGLQRAFKMSGVSSLIVSLWEVNDAVTATLMTSFYNALLQGNDYYTAFSIATDTVRKTTYSIQGSSISGENIALFGAFVLID